MTRVGFSVFGRPAIHEYCSNGLFNDVGLNSETYLDLPNGVLINKGQRIAILKRYQDSNGVEVISVFVNDYVIDTQTRSGAFVGSGVAFVGRPTPKLIVTTLSQLHRQALSLIDPDTKKFKESKIDCNKLALPDPNAKGYFYESYPKKYRKINEFSIGINVNGLFFENLMTAVQGFMYNTSFHGVTTAYISQDVGLLKQIVPQKYIYNTYHLLDFSNYFKSKEEKNKSLEKDILTKKESLKELEQSKNELLKKLELSKKRREQEIGERAKELDGIKKKIEVEERNLKNEKQKIAGLEREKEALENEFRNLKQIKSDNFEFFLQLPGFKKQRDEYERRIVLAKKKENRGLSQAKRNLQEQLNNTKSKLSLTSFVLLVVTLLLLLDLGFRGYDRFFKKESNTEKTTQQIKQPTPKIDTNILVLNLPEVCTANEFFELKPEEKKEHKIKIDAIIYYLSKIDSSKTKIAEPFLNRKWNFREVLDAGVKDDIDIGLKRVIKIKKIYKKFKKDDKLFSSDYLIEGLDFKPTERKFKSSSHNAILIEYLGLPNNIYENNDIERIGSGSDISKEDPILFMHFRWILFHFSAEEQVNKTDFLKTDKKKKYNIPIVK